MRLAPGDKFAEVRTCSRELLPD